MSESTRHRPIVNLAPNRPRSPPLHVAVFHPANNIAFLFLPACDFSSSLDLNFGIHHETLVTACQIIACNEPGFLSTDRDRNNPGVADPPDSIIPAAQYYFHLNTEPSNPLYPLCRDFASWNFPHNATPPSWDVQLHVPGNWDASWTVMSQNIKARDTACLVTGWRDSLTIAYVVPQNHEAWMLKNQMQVYLQNPHHPYHQSSPNLFALRGDMHDGQFDRGHFVIIPKFGQLHVHFLHYGNEAIAQYHNVVFDHRNTLSHAFLYARFALMTKTVGAGTKAVAVARRVDVVEEVAIRVEVRAEEGNGGVQMTIRTTKIIVLVHQGRSMRSLTLKTPVILFLHLRNSKRISRQPSRLATFSLLTPMRLQLQFNITPLVGIRGGVLLKGKHTHIWLLILKFEHTSIRCCPMITTRKWRICSSLKVTCSC